METLESPADIQTRCPTCQTVFEISESVAYSDDPRVRCGECYSIFNSHDHSIVSTLPDDLLVEDVAGEHEDSLEYATLEDVDEETIVFDPGYQDSEYSQQLNDIDLFSDNANLPEMSYLEDAEIPELDFDTIDPDRNQFDGTLFDDVNLEYTDMPTKGGEELSPDNSDHDNLSLEDRNDSVGETISSAIYSDHPASYNLTGIWTKRAVMLLVLVTVFGGLFIYTNRVKFQQSVVLGPLVKLVCVVGGCSAGEFSNLEKLVVVRRDVYSHPKVDNALVINIVFRNAADVEQPFPILAISMSDINGKVLAQRDFLPLEYLKNFDSPFPSEIAPMETIDLSLEVMDPGKDARSFELSFK